MAMKVMVVACTPIPSHVPGRKVMDRRIDMKNLRMGHLLREGLFARKELDKVEGVEICGFHPPKHQHLFETMNRLSG